MAELIGGAALGAAIAELLRVVMDTKHRATNFLPILTHIETTLKSIIPRIDSISHVLNGKLDEDMKELMMQLQNGVALVRKCRKLSGINLLKKAHYSKQLMDLDHSLLRYFQTILPLDLFKSNMEMLGIMRDLHMKLVEDNHQNCLQNPKSMISGGARLVQKNVTEERMLLCSLEDLYKGATKDIEGTRDVTVAKARLTIDADILKIKIKPGWKRGDRITFRGRRDKLHGYTSPDIVFTIDEKPHDVFERDGNDLVVTQDISPVEDLTGYKVHLKALDGRNLRIPVDPIISPTYVHVVEGEGMPIAEEPSKKGNLRIKFNRKNPPFACNAFKEGLNHVKKEKSEVVSLVDSYKKVWYPTNVQIEPIGNMYRYHRSLFLLKGCPYNLDIEILRRPDCKLIGMGSFGESYKCDTKDGPILVKNFTHVTMKISKITHQLEKLAVVGKHPNILPPFGFHFSDYDKFLLYDYLPTGSLYARLHDYDLGGLDPLDWDSKVKIALGTARGIRHLHNKDDGSGKLLHGNIKSSNVLLTADLNACISDYGLSLILKHSAPTSPNINTPILHKRGKRVTQESDVYRFGALLLELLTEQRPDSVIFKMWVSDIVSGKDISIVKESEHFHFGNCKEGMIKMLRIALLCLKKELNMRPNMDEVVSLIEDIKPSTQSRC